MLFLVLGDIGSGKTLFLTSIAFKYHQKRKIYSNFNIKLPNVEKFEYKLMLDNVIDNAILLLDEAYLLFDSREFMTNRNKLYSQLLFQSRKKSLDIYVAAQQYGSIDKRYRELAHVVIVAQKLRENIFLYTILRNNKITKFIMYPHTSLILYNYYDTNEIVQPDTKLNLDKLDRLVKFAKEKIETDNMISQDTFSTVTQSLVRYLTYKYDELKNLTKEETDYIYVTLKNSYKPKPKNKSEQSTRSKQKKKKGGKKK